MARFLFPALFIAVLALFVACGDDDDETDASPTPTASGAATASTPGSATGSTATATAAATTAAASATAAPTDTEAPEVTPPSACQDNPDPATDATNVVDSPEPFAAVSSPLVVTGQIEAFEAAFVMTLYDATG